MAIANDTKLARRELKHALSRRLVLLPARPPNAHRPARQNNQPPPRAGPTKLLSPKLFVGATRGRGHFFHYSGG
jgi:hypothetical protein